MKTSFFAMMVCVGLLCAVGYAQVTDMNAIRDANASNPASNVRHARWVFETIGASFQVYMFSRKAGNPTSNLLISVNGGPNTWIPSTTGYGNGISFGCAPNQDVAISIRNSSGDVFPASGWDPNGYCHVKVLGFPGYDIGTVHIPPGLWLGWEDGQNNTNPFDYNDFCIVLVGCRALFLNRDPICDNVWTRTLQDPHNINMPNRILSQKTEDKY